ncbi:MAG: hypothetical protein GWN00_37485 [Aliifodinibius sp.]|nr:hypothetical protein [Fodinibius sp.]NIV16706.1 hypothetical protein [Fodinibius sp.]NIY30273.1 hypothetical protein [Fodinibius sp.]
MKRSDLTNAAQTFSQKIKNTWQIFFLPSVLIYGATLLHLFYTNPVTRSSLNSTLRNIDLISFIIAIGLALIIFNMKRKYFSRRFSRDMVEDLLQKDPDMDEQNLLKKILGKLRGKMAIVWVLGLLIVLDGVIFYWITYNDGNMHIYFIIGAFSQLINYPRKDLFLELPWYVVEGRKDFERGEIANDQHQ